MILLTTVIALLVTPHLPGATAADERVRISVKLIIGNGRCEENPADPILPLLLVMDSDGDFSSGGKLFGQVDLGETVASILKTEDFMRIRIELNEPDKTPATLVLWVVDRISKNVKDGQRIEIVFTYWADAKKS